VSVLTGGGLPSQFCKPERKRERRERDLVTVFRRVACELIKQRSFHLCNLGLDHGARSALLVFVLVFVLVHPIQQRLC
jgi:hypothetical protein